MADGLQGPDTEVKEIAFPLGSLQGTRFAQVYSTRSEQVSMERKAPKAIMVQSGSADCGIERNVEESVGIDN